MLLDVLPIELKLIVDEEEPILLVIEEDHEETQLLISEDFVINGKEYKGDYIITPHAYDEQVLETKDKVCTENVVVLKVPKYETANLSGGNTVYIAEV